jgi:hypothetical protein
MGLGSEASDAMKLGRFAGRSAEEIAEFARIAGKSVDDVIKGAKDSAKLDADVIKNAKSSFKLAAGDLKDLGIVAGDSRGLGKDLTMGTDARAVTTEGATVAKDADKGVQNAVKDTDSYLTQARKACTSNKKMCAAGVLTGAAGIYAADKYLKVKGYKGQITKIEGYKDGAVLGYGGTPVAKVTYAKPIDILMTDTIDFSGTDCQPPLDGTKSPYKIAGPTEVWIKLDADLTAPGTTGTFKITTGVLSRLGQAVGEGGKAIGTVAGDVAGGAAGGLAGLVKGFASGAGMWLVIMCAVLIFGFIIFKFFM